VKFRIITLLVVLAAFFLPQQGMAFDNERQGFVLGLGGGFGSAKQSYGNNSDSQSGLATTLKIGGGISNQFLLYYSNRVVFLSEDSYQFAQGMSAIGFSVFLEPSGPSFFFSGEVGMGAWSSLESGGGSESGLGLTVGAGVALTPHFLVEANYMTASLGDGAYDWTLSNFTLTASWLGF
jgi:hypothetical protein